MARLKNIYLILNALFGYRKARIGYMVDLRR